MNQIFIDLDARFRIEYDLLFGGPDNWWQEMSYDAPPSDQDKKTFPFFLPEFGLRQGTRHGGVTLRTLSGAIAEIPVYKWEDGVYIDMHSLTEDRLGMYMMEIDSIARAAAYLGRDRVISRLINGDSSAVLMYDANNFFSNTHPIGAFNYDNLMSGVLNSANFQLARTAQMQFVNKNNRVMNLQANKLIVPPSLEYTAKELMNGALIAVASSAGVFGSVPNQLVNIADVITVAEMTDVNDWYLTCTQYSPKPFVHVAKKGWSPFAFFRQGVSADNTIAWETENAKFFGFTYEDWFPTHPFFSVKVVN
jgi:hypothetical protein